MVLIYFLPLKLQPKQENVTYNRSAFSSLNFNLDKVKHVASEVGFNGSSRVGAIYQGRYVVLHPDNLPGRQLYVDGSGTGWCGARIVCIVVEVSLFIDQQPEVGTFIITSLCDRKPVETQEGISVKCQSPAWLYDEQV